MARVEFSGIPREFETTRSFEVHDPTDSELKALRERVFGTDTEAETRTLLGRSLEQAVNPALIIIYWLRWRQFVQRLAFLSPEQTGGSSNDGPVIKEEVVTRYRTTKG